jgi:hypothetical protein
MFDVRGSPELARSAIRLQVGDAVIPSLKLMLWVHGAGTSCGLTWHVQDTQLCSRSHEPCSGLGPGCNNVVMYELPESVLVSI